MASRAEGKLHSIQHYVKMMLVISFSALILDFVISYATIAIVKQQSARYLQDAAYLYINRLNGDFAYLNHYMGWTLANDENLETMDRHDINDAEFLKANTNLYKRFVELQKSYGQEYNFFLYLRDRDYLQNCAAMTLSYPEVQALREKMASYVKDKNMFEKFYSRWSTLDLNGKFYIFNIVPYHDSYLICLISADDLILPLRQINLGKNGYASLIDENGRNVASPISNSGKAIAGDTGRLSFLNPFRDGTTVNGSFTNASFHVKLDIQFGTFERIMIAQLLIVLLAVIIACNLSFIMLYFKNKVLKPIKSFSYNLAFWNDDGAPLEFESSKMAELEIANKQFLHLVKQIKEYKIDIYERELEKQRIQLGYMQLQIKPHFFLNCLTTIYSMAQMQMDEEIQQMALSTSDYFRYLFQSGRDFVRLEDEIEHVRIYLEIQKSRYRDSFDYRIERSERTENVHIPPLVLQTFVENAIKYAVSSEYRAEIAVSVDRQLTGGEAVTVIRVSDTGPGFPPEVLEKLRRGEPLDQAGGRHIGIANTVRRLEYLYGKKARIVFSNRENAGACVSLYLPEASASEPQAIGGG